MTDPNRTHIAVVLDRSGSMSAVRDDTIGGFNTFVEEQRKAPGTCDLTLVQFDDQYEVNYVAVPIDRVAKLTTDTFQPRGMTALRDGIGRTINEVGRRLSAMAEDQRPGRVVFVIITDGQENASKEFGAAKIKEMIEHQSKAYSWAFMYLGANQDAVATGMSMGISGGTSVTYAAGNVAHAFQCSSSNVASYRASPNCEVRELDFSMVQRASLADPGQTGVTLATDGITGVTLAHGLPQVVSHPAVYTTSGGTGQA